VTGDSVTASGTKTGWNAAGRAGIANTAFVAAAVRTVGRATNCGAFGATKRQQSRHASVAVRIAQASRQIPRFPSPAATAQAGHGDPSAHCHCPAGSAAV